MKVVHIIQTKVLKMVLGIVILILMTAKEQAIKNAGFDEDAVDKGAAYSGEVEVCCLKMPRTHIDQERLWHRGSQ